MGDSVCHRLGAYYSSLYLDDGRGMEIIHEGQTTLFQAEKNEYEEFVDKFKPKLTTDDCYTPPIVYEAVVKWCQKEYGISTQNIVRPFYPGGDYLNFPYSEDSVVVDNPPFSILSQIIRFYDSKKISFFLFAPALTLFTAPECECCYLATGVSITYHNGAIVNTSFVTNMDKAKVRSAPDLFAAVNEANIRNKKLSAPVRLPKYQYPSEVITAAMVHKWSHYGVDFRCDQDEAIYIKALDSQRAKKKTIFGGGFLLKQKAAEAAEAAAKAAEAAEAEKTKVWELSTKEWALVYGADYDHIDGQCILFDGMEQEMLI